MATFPVEGGGFWALDRCSEPPPWRRGMFGPGPEASGGYMSPQEYGVR